MLLLVKRSLTKRLNCPRPLVLKDDVPALCSHVEHTGDAITHTQACFVLMDSIAVALCLHLDSITRVQKPLLLMFKVMLALGGFGRFPFGETSRFEVWKKGEVEWNSIFG